MNTNTLQQPDARSEGGEYGQVIAPGTVRFQRLLPGPIERVWAFLTESDQRAQWLAAGDMPPRPDAEFTLRFEHADLSPQRVPTPQRFSGYEGGVSTRHRVLRWEPPHTLAITWGGGDESASEVLFELAPVDGGVRLTLTHRRLGDKATMVDVAAGWHTHLAILVDRLAGSEPASFWARFLPLEADYTRRLAGQEASRP